VSLWDIFKSSVGENNNGLNLGQLHQKLTTVLPQADENLVTKVACISGLMARVAYVDMVIDPGEVDVMKKSLNDWSNLSNSEVDTIADLAIGQIKELAGLDNHKYCPPLNELLDNDEKFGILKSLFAMACGDGEVSAQESDEIKLITHGLRLDNKYYLAARAEVSDKLAALKK
jgi:uncharacterized tellurite resistance protein B-like protein